MMTRSRSPARRLRIKLLLAPEPAPRTRIRFVTPSILRGGGQADEPPKYQGEAELYGLQESLSRRRLSEGLSPAEHRLALLDERCRPPCAARRTCDQCRGDRAPPRSGRPTEVQFAVWVAAYFESWMNAMRRTLAGASSNSIHLLMKSVSTIKDNP